VFGAATFEIIEAEPTRLREVSGIGEMRATRIAAGWAEQKAVRDIMVFLHANGVGTSRAVRIFKTYGHDAIRVMTENPYRLGARHPRHRLPHSRRHRHAARPDEGGPRSGCGSRAGSGCGSMGCSRLIAGHRCRRPSALEKIEPTRSGFARTWFPEQQLAAG
jgi:hypothetical protein